jgi:hypothetical protein
MLRLIHPRRLAGGLTALLATVGFCGALAAQNAAKPPEAKPDEAQRADTQALVALVDEASAGKTPQTSLPITWEHEDFIKAQADKTYVPFTVAVEPGALTSSKVAVYLRVVKHGEQAPAASTPPPSKPDNKKGAADSRYPFEDLYFFDVQPAAAGQPQRIRRAFAVAPGEYDVYLAIRERPSATPATTATSGASPGAPTESPAAAGSSQQAAPGAAATSAAAPKVGLVTHTVTVPSFSADELTTSSIIVAEKVDVLQSAVATDHQAENPYTFGQMRILPASTNSFSKKGELSIVFWIYGAGLDATTKKPDVNIEFKFFQKTGDKETYFNKTDPQALNATTLPPQFDMAAGHQLPGSLAVPLASFPEGDYRLEITLTDKTSNKTLTRNVNFTVTS